MDFKERCAHCASLVEEENKWFCEEVAGFCEDIVWCPYFADRY